MDALFSVRVHAMELPQADDQVQGRVSIADREAIG